MMTLVLLLGGAFVGWNFPQPFWAKAVQAKLSVWWTEFRKKE